MSLSLPDGVRARPLRAEDAQLVAELASEDERALGGNPRLSAQDVTDWWILTDLAQGSWLLEDRGVPVAVGWLGRHGDTVVAVGFVRPGHKGRGLGSWLVEESEGRAATMLPARIHQIALGRDVAAHALLASRGYREARRHWEMAIELEHGPPAPDLPDGYRIETFRPEDARAFHGASAEAFEDEWGFHALPFDEWWEMRSHDPGFDPTLWLLIRDGGEVAAVARCVQGLRGGGHVGMLGVRKPWRRRGFGRALLLHAFGVFWGRGVRRVTLGVDSENPTGATRLYEGVGMHVDSEWVTLEKALA